LGLTRFRPRSHPGNLAGNREKHHGHG
jgi:hypothetical protein